MVTNEDRERKYADAITVGYAPEHRAMMARWFGDEVAAVMAVADAEQAELRAEIERWRDDWLRLDREASVSANALEARAEAAEAKVARVEALLDLWRRESDHRGPDDTLYTVGVVAMLSIALEPRSTEDDEEFCPTCFAGMLSTEHHQRCVVPDRVANESGV